MSRPAASPLARIAFATYRGKPGVAHDDGVLVDALVARGFHVEAVPWDSRADWSEYDAVLPRSTWDFHLRLAEFREWIARVEGGGTLLLNPRRLLEWNLTKHYLRELDVRGVRTVPTLWAQRGARGPTPSLREILAAAKWDHDVVVKPAVSASAHDTWVARIPIGADQEARFAASLSAAHRGLMVQPFLREIGSHGEWSLVFIAGAFSHAVLKRPADGDFRVQGDHGGREAAAVPSARVLADADAALDAAAAAVQLDRSEVLYARIDGIEEAGGLLLMELEALEPALFLAHAPASAAGEFARAVHAALTRRPRREVP